jgi:hypothetical protein
MTEYVIEKGIPLPNSAEVKGRGLPEALRQMDVGDSVLSGGQKESSVRAMAARMPLEFPGRKYSVRKTGAALRIWRTA